MKFTPEQIHKAERYITNQLKMHINDTYPSEERDLVTILLIIKNQKVDTAAINKASLEVEDENC